MAKLGFSCCRCLIEFGYACKVGLKLGVTFANEGVFWVVLRL
jgi:hypothetical protein